MYLVPFPQNLFFGTRTNNFLGTGIETGPMTFWEKKTFCGKGTTFFETTVL